MTGRRQVSWFVKNDQGEVVERGSVPLDDILNEPAPKTIEPAEVNHILFRYEWDPNYGVKEVTDDINAIWATK